MCVFSSMWLSSLWLLWAPGGSVTLTGKGFCSYSVCLFVFSQVFHKFTKAYQPEVQICTCLPTFPLQKKKKKKFLSREKCLLCIYIFILHQISQIIILFYFTKSWIFFITTALSISQASQLVKILFLINSLCWITNRNMLPHTVDVRSMNMFPHRLI